MSATATASSSSSGSSASAISEVEDVNMFQAARRTGRRNALGDLGEQLAQGLHSRVSLPSLVDSLLGPFFLLFSWC